MTTTYKARLEGAITPDGYMLTSEYLSGDQHTQFYKKMLCVISDSDDEVATMYLTSGVVRGNIPKNFKIIHMHNILVMHEVVRDAISWALQKKMITQEQSWILEDRALAVYRKV